MGEMHAEFALVSLSLSPLSQAAWRVGEVGVVGGLAPRGGAFPLHTAWDRGEHVGEQARVAWSRLRVLEHALLPEA